MFKNKLCYKHCPLYHQSPLKQRLILGCVTLFYVTCLLSCQSQSKIPGIKDFYVGVVKDSLFASFTSTTFNLDVGGSYEIPQLDHATVSLQPLVSGPGTVFSFDISLAALSTNLHQGEPMGFPDGRELPDIVGGTLPHFEADIGHAVLHIYLSPDAFAIFVPLNLTSPDGSTLPVMISEEVDDEHGNRLGKVYAIPAAANASGSRPSSGLFILLPYIGGQPNNPIAN